MNYDRYDNLKIKFDNNKRVYDSILLPAVVKDVSDIYIAVKETDRFDLLSFKYYKTVTFWWIIAMANDINGTMFPPTGMIIKIPYNVSEIISNLGALNS